MLRVPEAHPAYVNAYSPEGLEEQTSILSPGMRGSWNRPQFHPRGWAGNAIPRRGNDI